jgi:hemoglobin
MATLSDIQNRQDITLFVNAFYAKVNANEELSRLFNGVAQVDWTQHLPKMYDFWEHIIFGTGNYNGRPMPPHLDLNQKSPLLEGHFNTWKSLFTATIDELFLGPNAELTKLRAYNIAAVMQFKTAQMQKWA